MYYDKAQGKGSTNLPSANVGQQHVRQRNEHSEHNILIAPCSDICNQSACTALGVEVLVVGGQRVRGAQHQTQDKMFTRPPKTHT